ncbi:MAG: cytochrome c [Kiloniellales bacterium]|nr:cytochrome c [Kiloniellales bacterium]
MRYPTTARGRALGRGQSCLGQIAVLAIVGLLALAGNAVAQGNSGPGDATRGEYLFRAAGCYACHTRPVSGARPLAGGRAFATPYGTFYSPNITPDPDHGIGRWGLADFARAVRLGEAPDGSDYFPAFPFPSYTGMQDQDLADLWAYLQGVDPVPEANREHELDFPFGFRFLAGVWKRLFFEAGAFQPDPAKDATWNRGAYLVRHLGHCGECHTPRNFLGALEDDRDLAGTLEGPDGKKVPNVTPHPKDGIGEWSDSDITFFLQLGVLPDGDVAGGAMEDVIREGTGHLTDEDRKAIAAYLKSLPEHAGP